LLGLAWVFEKRVEAQMSEMILKYVAILFY